MSVSGRWMLLCKKLNYYGRSYSQNNYAAHNKIVYSTQKVIYWLQFSLIFSFSPYVQDVPLVEFMYLVLTSMLGESYRRRLRSCVTSFEC